MTKKLNILITNDDGIEAPGLRHLWEALVDVANVSIVAPSSEKSGVGVSLTLHEPLHYRAVKWEKATPAWRVSGTPADCVRMALSVVLDTPPDLIVSGINCGANSGRNVLYSGTIGAVIEGMMHNVPGIAFSCVDFSEPDYSKALPFIYPLIQHLTLHPLSKGTFLNVNFPDTKEIRGVRLARQGMGFWDQDFSKRIHPQGHSYFWHGVKWSDHEEDEESDVHLLKQGFATAVPIHVREWTDLEFYKSRKAHFDSTLSPTPQES